MSRKTVQELVDLLDADHWRVRMQALQALDEIDVREVMTADMLSKLQAKLQTMRRDANNYVSEWADHVLDRHRCVAKQPAPQVEDAQDLIQKLLRSRDSKTLEKSIIPIVKMLSSPDWKARVMSLQLLDRIDPETVEPHIGKIIPVLDPLAKENTWHVQEWALYVLGKQNPAKITIHVSDIMCNMKKRVAVVRKAAIQVLGMQNATELQANQEVIRAHLADPDSSVREATLRVLCKHQKSPKSAAVVGTHATDIQERLTLGMDADTNVRSIARGLLHGHNPNLLRCTWPPFLDDLVEENGGRTPRMY